MLRSRLISSGVEEKSSPTPVGGRALIPCRMSALSRFRSPFPIVRRSQRLPSITTLPSFQPGRWHFDSIQSSKCKKFIILVLPQALHEYVLQIDLIKEVWRSLRGGRHGRSHDCDVRLTLKPSYADGLHVRFNGFDEGILVSFSSNPWSRTDRKACRFSSPFLPH